MIKVLLASPKGGVSGGIARWTEHVLRYYDTLDDSSVHLSFFNTARKKQSPDNFFKRVARALLEYPTMIRDLSRILRKNKFDVIHFTSSASLGLLRDLIIIRIAKHNNTKPIIHFRFGRTPEILKSKNWECFLLKKVVSSVSRAIFIDKSSYEAIVNSGYKNVELLPNPLSPDISNLVNTIKETERESRFILYVGHCYEEKGIFELAQACKNLSDLKLKYVGSVKDSIKQQLLDYGTDYIQVVGEESYEKIIEEMLKCDLFVLPSYTEGFPNVILEAMACGCAIIATNVGAIPEMLDENGASQCGLIIHPRDVKELSDAISSLLDDNRKKQNFRLLAKQRVMSLYSMDVVWKKMADIWINTSKNKYHA